MLCAAMFVSIAKGAPELLSGGGEVTGALFAGQDFPGGPEPERGASHDGEAGLQEQRRDQHCALQPRLPHPRHLLPFKQETRALSVRGEWGPSWQFSLLSVEKGALTPGVFLRC